MALGPQLTAILKRYGLEELTQWASDALVQGKSEDQIMLEIYDQQAFKTRFAGLFKLEANGYPPISVDNYLDYEKTASSLGTAWGLKLTKAEVDNLIGNNISAMELEQRFTITSTAIHESDINTRSELSRLFNIDQNQLMRYWMDPKRQLGVLQQQYRMGEIAGAAMRTGFGQINLHQASRLQEAGLTGQQAQQGFGELETLSGLFTPLDEGEDLFDIDQQIDLLTGDTDAAKELEKRQQRRKSEFGGSGGFASGQSGFATGEAD